jgi:hypothetical protein
MTLDSFSRTCGAVSRDSERLHGGGVGSWAGSGGRNSSYPAPPSRAALLWADGMSYAQILQRASTLPPRSVDLLQSLDVDAQGSRIPLNACLVICAAGECPGVRRSKRRAGPRADWRPLDVHRSRPLGTPAGAALRILAGTSPSLIKVPVQRPGPPTFDWRELQRWGVSEVLCRQAAKCCIAVRVCGAIPARGVGRTGRRYWRKPS